MRILTRLYWKIISLIFSAKKETRHFNDHSYDAIVTGSSVGYLFIHGGGWTEGSRTDGYMGDPIAFGKIRKTTTLNADYPLARPDGNKYPAPIDYLEKLLKSASKRYGVTSWIVVGASAGANIGALLCQRVPMRCHRFVGYYGCYDLTRFEDFNDEVSWRIPVYTARPESASPVLQAWPSNVSVTLIHGADDSWVSPQQSKVMSDTTGYPTVIIPNVNHAFNIVDDMLIRGI